MLKHLFNKSDSQKPAHTPPQNPPTDTQPQPIQEISPQQLSISSLTIKEAEEFLTIYKNNSAFFLKNIDILLIFAKNNQNSLLAKRIIASAEAAKSWDPIKQLEYYITKENYALVAFVISSINDAPESLVLPKNNQLFSARCQKELFDIACQQDNVPLVKFLVANGLSLHNDIELGHTPLEMAFYKKADQVALFLISKNATFDYKELMFLQSSEAGIKTIITAILKNPHYKKYYISTPYLVLSFIQTTDNSSLVDWVIKLGEETKEWSYEDIFELALKEDDLKSFAQIIELPDFKKNLITLRKSLKLKKIFVSLCYKTLGERKSLSILTMLLDSGLNPNTIFNSNESYGTLTFMAPQTLLSIAASRNQYDLVKFLIGKGADPTLQGGDAIEYIFDNSKMCELLLRKRATKLLYAENVLERFIQNMIFSREQGWERSFPRQALVEFIKMLGPFVKKKEWVWKGKQGTVVKAAPFKTIQSLGEDCKIAWMTSLDDFFKRLPRIRKTHKELIDIKIRFSPY